MVSETNRIPRICNYCDYRHCCCEDSDSIDIVMARKDDAYGCKHFKLGKCFNCSVFKAKRRHAEICPPYVDFEGCANYKE